MCPRASDDPEKTTTTYLEEPQPSHGETGRGSAMWSRGVGVWVLKNAHGGVVKYT